MGADSRAVVGATHTMEGPMSTRVIGDAGCSGDSDRHAKGTPCPRCGHAFVPVQSGPMEPIIDAIVSLRRDRCRSMNGIREGNVRLEHLP